MGPREILVIALVIILLFGAKKLPELARSMGRSMRIFKSEMKEMKAEDGQQAPAANAQAEQDYWERPENQPRQIEPTNAQTPIQNTQIQGQQDPQQR